MSDTPFISEPGRPSLDVCVLWDWSYDDDFVNLLRHTAQQQGKTFASYLGEHVVHFIRSVEEQQIPIGRIIDRVSDVQPGITVPLVRLKRQGTILINDTEKMVWCRDKATMHFALLRAGVQVPYSVIISTAEHPDSLDMLEMVDERLGDPFVIKPVEGGGGDNVVLNMHSRKDIIDYLARTGEGRIVLQRKILPCRFGDKRGWFRIFWVLGYVIPCWWDDLSHLYQVVSLEEEKAYSLHRLSIIAGLVAKVSNMDLFTTEIAVNEDGEFVVVDAVNEMPDLRLQSKHLDGVPDTVVDQIANVLVASIPA